MIRQVREDRYILPNFSFHKEVWILTHKLKLKMANLENETHLEGFLLSRALCLTMLYSHIVKNETSFIERYPL